RSAAARGFREPQHSANWLAELMDGLGLEQAAFAGHSSGGRHALNFAVHYPARIRHMMLLAPTAAFARTTNRYRLRLLAARMIRTRGVILNGCAGRLIGKGNAESIHPALLEQFYLGMSGCAWKHRSAAPAVFTDEALGRVKPP